MQPVAVKVILSPVIGEMGLLDKVGVLMLVPTINCLMATPVHELPSNCKVYVPDARLLVVTVLVLDEILDKIPDDII